MPLFRLLILLALTLVSGHALPQSQDPHSDAFWYGTAADGSPTVRLYYF